MYKAFSLSLLALVLGFAINFLTFEQGMGLNMPLCTALFLGGTYLGMYIGGHKLPLRAHIAALFALLFALPFAFWTSATALTISYLGNLVALVLFIAFAIGRDAHFTHPLDVAWAGTGYIFTRVIGRISFLGKIQPPRIASKHWSVIKGALILFPLLLIFTALFASADAVFENYLGDLETWLQSWMKLEKLIPQAFIITFWTLAIALFFGAAAYERYPHEPRKERESSWIVESKVILAGIAVLFAAFLAIQASVMFGGSAAFAELDMTYSEYAREGTNQLIAVSVLVALITLTLRDQHGNKVDRVLTFLHAALIIETLLVLVSAYLRLNLYVDAYGYTELRLLAYWGIMTIGLMLALLLANVLQRESQIALMKRALIVLGVCGVVFAFSAPDVMAARFNLRRIENNHPLDMQSLQKYSAEAIPLLVDELKNPVPFKGVLDSQPTTNEYCSAFHRSNANKNRTYTFNDEQASAVRYDLTVRRQIANWLDREYAGRKYDYENADWRDWNYSRTRANDILPVATPDWLNLPDYNSEYETACAGVQVDLPEPPKVDLTDRPR